MAVIKKLVEDDTKPIVLRLKRKVVSDTGAVTYESIDLTDAAVDLIMQNSRTDEITNTGHQSCDIVDEPNGVIKYSPAATDYATKGRYICDIKINYPDNTVEILYENLIIKARKKIT